VYNGFGGKHEGESPLGRCEDNIKMDLEGMRSGAWTGLICSG
jgi:hypothetical protein